MEGKDAVLMLFVPLVMCGLSWDGGRCVLSAFLGMCTVVWYSTGGPTLSEAEIEDEVRQARAEKQARGKFFGLLKPRAAA